MMKLTKRFGSLLIAFILTGAALSSPWLTSEAVLASGEPDSLLARADTLASAAAAASAAVEPVPFTLPFAVDSLCRLQDEQRTLDRFFRELEALKQGKDTVITVVHLGDSHVQCGYLSGQIMRLFHGDFGNAGRGLVVPLKLSRTNEPDDYFLRSTITDWQKGRCVQRTPQCPVGVGGIGIRTAQRKINLEVIIAENNGAGYAFDRAVLFRHPKATPLVATTPSDPTVRMQTGKEPVCPGVACDTFRVGRLTDTLFLRSRTQPAGSNNLYYALSLTNGRPGVLYHSIGVNGAMFVNYTDSSYIRQLALLKPSLLIVSMGTNETFGRRFNAPEFQGQVARLLDLIGHYLPGAALLLTTPPECYQRKTINKKRVYQRNPNTDTAARTLVEYARKRGIACWDLYTATGGKGSSEKWYKENGFGRDRIHFTKETYREQGNLFYRALMKNYNEYIRRSSGPVVSPALTDSSVAYGIQ